MKFRAFLKKLHEDIGGQINGAIDSAGYVFFFKKGKEIFGAGEDSRVIFAKIKNPDEELPKNWEEDANFSADNLNKVVRGEPAQQVFRAEDLKQIEVIDREKAVANLQKVAEKLGDKAFPKRSAFKIDLSRFFAYDPDQAPFQSSSAKPKL